MKQVRALLSCLQTLPRLASGHSDDNPSLYVSPAGRRVLTSPLQLKYGYTPFLSSPSGCHPPLSIKRQIRNPYSKYHPYHSSCPELVDLFEWCPPAPSTPPAEDGSDIQVFGGEVPWGVKGKGKTRWGKWED